MVPVTLRAQYNCSERIEQTKNTNCVGEILGTQYMLFWLLTSQFNVNRASSDSDRSSISGNPLATDSWNHLQYRLRASHSMWNVCCTSVIACGHTFKKVLLIRESSILVKVKCTFVLAMRLCTGRSAHKGSRGIALLFHDHGTRRGWRVSVTPRPLSSILVPHFSYNMRFSYFVYLEYWSCLSKFFHFSVHCSFIRQLTQDIFSKTRTLSNCCKMNAPF
jgi:hypothetical protein